MKTVTILGSSGQIGAYLTTYLREKGYKVYEHDLVRGPLEDMTYFPSTLLETKIRDSDFVFFLGEVSETFCDRISSDEQHELLSLRCVEACW